MFFTDEQHSEGWLPTEARGPSPGFALRAPPGNLRIASRAKVGGARRNRTDDLLLAKQALSQLSYGPNRDSSSRNARLRFATARQPSLSRACRAEAAERRRLVGLGRFELPTSRLSSARSNQLSYRPRAHARQPAKSRRARGQQGCSNDLRDSVGSSGKKEKRRRRSPAKGPDQPELIGPMCS